MSKIGIVDYGSGNIHSIEKALKYVGAETNLITEPKQVDECDKIILPGVGAFGSASRRLQSLGFKEKILKVIIERKPVLGICVGMQMLFERSFEYGEHSGLAALSGSIEKIKPSVYMGLKVKIPHIGWSAICRPVKNSNKLWNKTILKGISEDTKFYFVHSYSANPKNPDICLADTIYGSQHLTAAVQSGNLYGTQFHPEKSGEAGLVVLENFSKL